MRVGWGFTPHCPFYSAGITYLGATQPHSPTRLGTGVAHNGPTLRLSSHPPPIPMRVSVGGSHKAVCFLAFVRLLHLYWR